MKPERRASGRGTWRTHSFIRRVPRWKELQPWLVLFYQRGGWFRAPPVGVLSAVAAAGTKDGMAGQDRAGRVGDGDGLFGDGINGFLRGMACHVSRVLEVRWWSSSIGNSVWGSWEVLYMHQLSGYVRKKAR